MPEALNHSSESTNVTKQIKVGINFPSVFIEVNRRIKENPIELGRVFLIVLFDCIESIFDTAKDTEIPQVFIRLNFILLNLKASILRLG